MTRKIHKQIYDNTISDIILSIGAVTVVYTPCPSAPVGCVPVASPVDKFTEIFSPVPNYASPANT